MTFSQAFLGMLEMLPEPGGSILVIDPSTGGTLYEVRVLDFKQDGASEPEPSRIYIYTPRKVTA